MCDVCLIADQLAKVWRAEEADILVINPTTGGSLVRFYKHAAPLGRGEWTVFRFYKHTAPLGQGEWTVFRFYKHTAPLGQGEWTVFRFYKHAAPLGQGDSLRTSEGKRRRSRPVCVPDLKGHSLPRCDFLTALLGDQLCSRIGGVVLGLLLLTFQQYCRAVVEA